MTDGDPLAATDKVRYEVSDHVATVTINRPEKLNAMDPETYTALSAAWARVRDDGEVWAALVTGAGEEAFSAGADLEETIRPGETDWAAFWRTQEELLLNNGMEVWKPVIAAVDGYCLAGGLTLLLATDIRVAGADATFGLAEVKRGILPANGGTQRIVRQLPYPLAMELLLTGDAIDAGTAAEWGLINEVVDAGEAVPAGRAIADRVVSNAPLAVRAIKELAVRGRSMPLADAMRLEASFARHLSATEDAAEGVAAFREDRQPDYRGK